MIIDLKKSWIPLSILLIVIISIVFGALYEFNFVKIRAPSSPEPGCVVMKDRGQYSDTIDIVFLAENYNEISNFLEDSVNFMNSFLNVKPYSDYKDRFNFFRIENLGLDLGCTYEDDAVVCDPVKVKTESVGCPYDYPVVLVETNGVKNFFNHLRSSSWRGIASINSADDPLVLAHEAGHQISGLGDEYTWKGGKVFMEIPNCDSQLSTCPKFQEVDGAGCYAGCINYNHARSVDIGIMRDYWKSSSYGLFDEFIIEQAILGKSTKFPESSFLSAFSIFPKESPSPMTLVKYSCDVDNSCQILEVIQGIEGYITSDQGADLFFVQGITKIGVINKGIYNYLIIEGYNLETNALEGEYFLEEYNDIVLLPFDHIEGIIKLEDAEGNVLDEIAYVPNPELLSKFQQQIKIISSSIFFKIHSVI
jgi:hypothetical protein